MKPAGHQAPASKGLLPVRSHRMPLIPQQQVVTKCPECSQLRILSTRVFTGGCSHRHPLGSANPNSRLREGEREFCMNRTVGTNRASQVSHPSQSGWEGASGQAPTVQAELSRDGNRACCVNNFLHTVELHQAARLNLCSLLSISYTSPETE